MGVKISAFPSPNWQSEQQILAERIKEHFPEWKAREERIDQAHRLRQMMKEDNHDTADRSIR